MYSKGKEFLFNADDIRIPYKMKTNVRKGTSNNPKGKIPTDVWTKNNHTTSAEYAGWHPTQKPIELLERIIKAHTKEGNSVLDIFSGSGSTMIAADKCGRKFIGAEFDQDYYHKSLDRLEKLKVKCYKIGSGEFNNLPLVEYICKKNKPMILMEMEI